jgi:hypothetical protein
LVEDYFTELYAAVSEEKSRQTLKLAQGLKHGTLAERFKLIDDHAKVDLFAMLDNDARRVWDEYLAARDLTGLERLRKIRGLKPRMAPYIISVSQKQAQRRFPDAQPGELIPIHPVDLERCYDVETGFKRD